MEKQKAVTESEVYLSTSCMSIEELTADGTWDLMNSFMIERYGCRRLKQIYFDRSCSRSGRMSKPILDESI
ncbi:MAG: hypothetical protein MJ127_03140 [Mogibacterium sp.]|nr:hypothetical protein [Mogibacterium sp.]